jgi:hypothetical protein
LTAGVELTKGIPLLIFKRWLESIGMCGNFVT